MCYITLRSARYFSLCSLFNIFSLADESRIGEMILSCWIRQTFSHHSQRGTQQRHVVPALSWTCARRKMAALWIWSGLLCSTMGCIWIFDTCQWQLCPFGFDLSRVYSRHVISFDVATRNNWSTIIFIGIITFTYWICINKMSLLIKVNPHCRDKEMEI